MPGAVIAFDQARPGPTTSSGSPGVARKDLWLLREVTARSTAVGNTSYAWAFLDIPPGSATVLTDESTSDAKWAPDMPGSYRLQLTTNGGGPGNVQVLIAAVTFDNAGVLTQRGWRIPAFGEVSSEDNFAGQMRGWGEALEFILADIRVSLDAAGASGYFEVTPSAATLHAPEVINVGTAKGEARTKESSLFTNDAGPHTLDVFTIPADTMSILDIEIVAINADATLGVWWKKSKGHLSTAGTIIEGVVRDVDTETIGAGAPAWTVAFDVSGATARVRVNSAGDDVTWYIVRQALRVLKT